MALRVTHRTAKPVRHAVVTRAPAHVSILPRMKHGALMWLLGMGLVAGGLAGCDSDADPSSGDLLQAADLGSTDVVISQLYGGGGNAGAPLVNDYVELFNRGTASVSVAGWSVQYAAASGTSWAKANLTGTIPAGGYYLVRLASSGSVGAALPAADATGTMNMSGTSGTVALVTNQTLLSCGGSTACLPDASVRDFVGYGAAVQSETSSAPTQSNTTAGFRASRGCTDTNNNAADFATGAPTPRNASSAHATCTGGGTTDAGVPDAPTGPADAPVGTGDGTPTRVACTGSFGSAMTATFGRLDGFLVSVVDVNGSSTCRGDDNHIHLQIRVNGRIEDIAVNTASTTGSPNVDTLTINSSLKGGAWSEGWHPGLTLDYPTNLGVSSGEFTERTPTQVASLVDATVANANHISIFTTGFDATGGHLIHRNGSSHDGAIVINPLSANPEYLLFHFTTQSF
jgi:hypothetical protein